MVEVELSWPEAMQAVVAGAFRRIASLKNGLRNQHGFDDEEHDGWGVDIEGAAGEMAVAKFFDQYYVPTLNTFKSMRDSCGCEIRTTKKHSNRLIVREKDDDSHIYILVTGQIPTFRIRGWMYGREAKQEKWVEGPNGRSPAWFIPSEELRPMEELKIH